MPLPLIIKAAALGGAAYAASRWLSAQRRQQRSRNDHYAHSVRRNDASNRRHREPS